MSVRQEMQEQIGRIDVALGDYKPDALPSSGDDVFDRLVEEMDANPEMTSDQIREKLGLRPPKKGRKLTSRASPKRMVAAVKDK